MVQGYYTLQEAAQVLGMPPEELKQMAQKNQIRSFQDRGTWRFRVQDIQELARQRGAASDLELVLGEASKSNPPKSGPKSGTKSDPKTPHKTPPKSPVKPAAPEVFDFALDGGESVGVGREDLSPSGKKKPDSKRGPSTPPVPPGSDSDVRLVADSSDMGFVFDAPVKSASDSDVKLVPHDSPKPKSSQPPSPRKSAVLHESPLPKKSSKIAGQDSPVRLVPMDSDSDVKIVGAGAADVDLGDLPPLAATDSDIRLEPMMPKPPSSQEGLLTEEINLDEELRQQEVQSQKKPQAKVKPKSKLPKFPSVSPFELSQSQLKMPASSPGQGSKPDSSDFDLTPESQKPPSSDYDLTPEKQKSPSSSDFDLSPGQTSDSSSDDFSLELPDESGINLESSGERELKGPSSGISLGNPADSGISLEQGGEGSDEIEFELSLDAQATPKPASQASSDSSSEFELSLDSGEGPVITPEAPSDSEFELTLDDSGNLSEETPQLKADKEKDIFETDFEVPALEEESGSQVAALDTDLDSSDFDLALGDSDVAVEEDSGSEVVALDEEEADDAAATVAAKRKTKHKPAADLAEDEDLGFDQLDEEAVAAVEEEEEEAAGRVVVKEKVQKAAPWGVMPVLLMLPCVVVMLLVGIMGFELVQNMAGYKPTGFVTKTIGELTGQKLK